MNLTITDTPEYNLREVLSSRLGRFNSERAGPGEWRPIAAVLHDDAGDPVGGLLGTTSYGWLFVEMLFVPDAMRGRGVGTQIMRGVEAEAAARGCRGAWLDTFEFQARGFYERLGYSVFAQLDDYPAGFSRFFMRKSWRPIGSAEGGPE